MTPPSPQNHTRSNDTWSTRRLLSWTTDYFAKKNIDNPRLAAEMLLAHVLSTKRLQLYMDADRPASDLERAALRDLVERAVAHEPVDYLVGHAPFFSMTFKVTPAVLIPRPSTEKIVEHLLQHARRTPGFRSPRVADICTGSGAIAISIAKHLQAAPHTNAVVTATDKYDNALAIAKQNAAEHDVDDKITFRQGDLLEPIKNERFHYLVSNPPYIPDHEWPDVAPNVKNHEPTHALRAGLDGLDYLKPLIQNARDHLQTPGQLILEIAASHKDAVLALAQKTPGLTNAHILADHEKLPRVLVADAV